MQEREEPATRPFDPCRIGILRYVSGSPELLAKASSITVEIVRKLTGQVGFVLLPRRRVVEGFLAWTNRNRRLAKDFEATIQLEAAFLYAAATMLLLQRISRRA